MHEHGPQLPRHAMAMKLAAVLASDRPAVAGSMLATPAQQATNAQNADQLTAESQARESTDRRARFVGQLRKCRGETDCQRIWKEIDEGLHKLTLVDADAVTRELTEAFERSFAKMPQAADGLRATVVHFLRNPDAIELMRASFRRTRSPTKR